MPSFIAWLVNIFESYMTEPHNSRFWMPDVGHFSLFYKSVVVFLLPNTCANQTNSGVMSPQPSASSDIPVVVGKVSVAPNRAPL
jgi:hypothetical protein